MAPSSQAPYLVATEMIAHASPMQAAPTQACRTSSVPPLDASTPVPTDPTMLTPRLTTRAKQKARKRKNPSNDARQSASEVEPLVSLVRSIRQRSDLNTDNEAPPSSSTHETFTKHVKEEAQRLAYKKEDEVWVVNPETVALNPTDVLEKLLVPMEYKPDASRSFEVETWMRLKAEALTNKEFKQKSSYMYIFGCGQYFELDVEEMEPATQESGIIVRPLEKKGMMAVLARMVKLNYAKQILTVIPNTEARPTCWHNCIRNGPLKIINGQHTWKAAKKIIEGETVVDDAAVALQLRSWTCEIVWSKNKDHLHTLSAKCNNGNNLSPYLSSLPATILHYFYLWKNAGKLKHFWKNTAEDRDEEFWHYEVRWMVQTGSNHVV